MSYAVFSLNRVTKSKIQSLTFLLYRYALHLRNEMTQSESCKDYEEELGFQSATEFYFLPTLASWLFFAHPFPYIFSDSVKQILLTVVDWHPLLITS